jgi:DNA invertase Pin-like site-specific DNA recombinase
MTSKLNDIKKILGELNIMELYAYSRKSRDIDGEGLKKHKAIIEEFANTIGLPLKVLEEVGSSETLNRPMLNELREQIKNGKVKALLIYRLDRLSRKTTDLERLLAEFSFHEVLLIEVHREKVIDYNETLQTKLEAIMNDLYQEGAKMVLNAGRKKAVELHGNHLGIAPIGYDYNKETKKLEPNDQAFLVQRVFDLYLNDNSYRKIAIQLNDWGYKTALGNRFQRKSVELILKNEKYIGRQVYGQQKYHKDEHGKCLVKNVPKEDWIVYNNAHQPIISEEVFNKVRKIREKRGKAQRNALRHTFPLSGIVKCGVCGATLTFNRDRRNKERKRYYLRGCPTFDYVLNKKCRNGIIPTKIIEKFILEKIQNEVIPKFAKVNVDLAKNSEIVVERKIDKELEHLLKEKKEVEKQYNNILELLLKVPSNDLLTAKLTELTNKIEYVTMRIKELEKDNYQETETDWVDNFLELQKELLNFLYIWNTGTYTEKNKLVTKYVERVEYISEVGRSDVQSLEIKYTSDVERVLSL